jgi:hypothetical protein
MPQPGGALPQTQQRQLSRVEDKSTQIPAETDLPADGQRLAVVELVDDLPRSRLDVIAQAGAMEPRRASAEPRQQGRPAQTAPEPPRAPVIDLVLPPGRANESL